MAGPAFHAAIGVNQPRLSVLDRKNAVRTNLRASLTTYAFGDIKLELWDQLPGDAVVMVVRRGVEATQEEITFELY